MFKSSVQLFWWHFCLKPVNISTAASFHGLLPEKQKYLCSFPSREIQLMLGFAQPSHWPTVFSQPINCHITLHSTPVVAMNSFCSWNPSVFSAPWFDWVIGQRSSAPSRPLLFQHQSNAADQSEWYRTSIAFSSSSSSGNCGSYSKRVLRRQTDRQTDRQAGLLSRSCR